MQPNTKLFIFVVMTAPVYVIYGFKQFIEYMSIELRSGLSVEIQ